MAERGTVQSRLIRTDGLGRPRPADDAIILPVLALFLAAACALAHAAAQGGTWPLNIDLFRDMAAARSMLDGHWRDDPYYAGEKLWYNPLVPALVAAFSRLARMPLPEAYARAGVWINLLAPATFFLLARRLFGSRVALFSVAAFLFITSNDLPSETAATYSPWLYPSSVAQAFFYLALWAYARALETGTIRRHILAGALLGLAFLAHTAPALILIWIVVAETAIQWWRGARGPGHALPGSPDDEPAADRDPGVPWARRLFPTLLLAVAFFAVSLPFTSSILFHYGLHIRNPLPSGWVWEPLRLGNESKFLREHLLRPAPLLVSLVSGAGLLGGAWRRGAGRLLVIWTAVALLGLLWSYPQQALWRRQVALPGIVPSFHFLFYLRAAASLLFGLGLSVLGARLRSLFKLRGPAWVPSAVLCAAALLASVPGYVGRADLVQGRRALLAMSQRRDEINATEWIETHTSKNAVFLAPDRASVLVVGPTGRKEVVVHSAFSNPYVDQRARARDRAAMMNAAAAGDREAFLQLARPYHLTHVLTDGGDQGAFGSGVPGVLRREFLSGGVAIYSVL